MRERERESEKEREGERDRQRERDRERERVAYFARRKAFMCPKCITSKHPSMNTLMGLPGLTVVHSISARSRIDLIVAKCCSLLLYPNM